MPLSQKMLDARAYFFNRQGDKRRIPTIRLNVWSSVMQSIYQLELNFDPLK